MFEPNTNVIINSNKEVFIFQLTKDGEVTYHIYDHSLTLLNSNILYDKNILKYSALIDEENTIHLIALINTGELNYYKYTEDRWAKGTIAKFDLKSNIYNQIEILMIKNKIHILYNYSNLINSNIWTIQHIIYNNNIEEKHNAIRYISKKAPYPFIIDGDSQGTIHLLYRNNLKDPQVYHSFYSPYTKSWSSLAKQISLDNSLMPFLFIDSQNNLHGLWLEEQNEIYQLRYLKMSSSGKEKYIWKEIYLPYISISKYPPIIFEEKGKLKLLFSSKDSIRYFYSNDYGNSWSLSQEYMNKTPNTFMVKTNSNLLFQGSKVSSSYYELSTNSNFYFLDLFSNDKSLEFEIQHSIQENTLETVDIVSKILSDINIKLDEILENNVSIKSNLAQLNKEQEYTNKALEHIQLSLNSNKKSFIDKFFNWLK